MRFHTLKRTEWSAMAIVIGVELEFADTDGLLRTKSSKFASLRTLLEAWL
jgi:hypothetical protein